MALQRTMLDTDTLTAVMRQHSTVTSNAQAYLKEHHRFHFSIITQYEILRGLKAKGATKQIAVFENFCSQNTILSLSKEIISKAAEIYADLRKRGELIGDADILIAATAIVNKLGIVTNNEKHFQRIPELHVENWLRT